MSLQPPGQWLRPRSSSTRVEVLERLRATPDCFDVYRDLAQEVDARLGLASTLNWCPGLDAITGTPGIEEVLFSRGIQVLQDGNYQDALSLAEFRLTRSPWASDLPPGWGSKWRAAHAIARSAPRTQRSRTSEVDIAGA